MVTSQPDNFERRQTIRSTWGSKWHNTTHLPPWKTVFQLGQSKNTTLRRKAELEAVKYNDMIFGDFVDIFFHLPIKVIMAFEWATKFCNFDYLLKSDDDVFIHIPNIFQFLSESYIPNSRLYAGNVRFDDIPVRWTRHERDKKYIVTTQEYAPRNYPRYCSGGGYVLSRDVAADMVETHNNSNYFKLDDVYIGFLALKLGVDAQHEKKFWLQVTDGECQEGLITKHFGHNIDCMEWLYNCGRRKSDKKKQIKVVTGKSCERSTSGQEKCTINIFFILFLLIFCNAFII